MSILDFLDIDRHIACIPRNDSNNSYYFIVHEDNSIVAIVEKYFINDTVKRNLYKKDLYIAQLQDVKHLKMTRAMCKYIMSKMLK